MFQKWLVFIFVPLFCISIVKADDPRIEYWPNGNKKSEYEMKDGKENGKSTTWYEDGSKKSEHEWLNGQKNGKSKLWYKSGKIKAEFGWKDGKLEGKSIFWYENGVKNNESEFKDGLYIGKSITWYDSGIKHFEWIYESNNSNYISYIWDEKGIKIAEIKTINDKKVKSIVYFANGTIRSEFEFKNDEIKKISNWYETGIKNDESEFIEDKSIWKTTKWDDKGVKISEVEAKIELLNDQTKVWKFEVDKLNEENKNYIELIK